MNPPRPRAALDIDTLLLPFRLFMGREASGGILLIFSTAIALVWANSPFAPSYHALWQTPVSIGIGGGLLEKPLLIWINDGLMAMFFFVVGLEIKREILVGELSSLRLATLPIAAAIGGMVVPAAFYLLCTQGGVAADGWGIPMATDIAFALGILVLLGDRVPAALKVFLTALAIVDDLGAVLVIAFFYTSNISFGSLALGAGFLGALLLANKLGVRNVIVYATLGIGGLWLAFLLSGVHPTVAGVLAALCIPARTKLDAKKFIDGSREVLQQFESSGETAGNVLTNKERQAALLRHKFLYERATSPLQRLEKSLHPWVIYVIMPIFALSNAGVSISGDITEVLKTPVSLGIFLGLVLGKQAGIFLGAWLAVRLKVAELPKQVTWRGVYGVAWLGGIGFTMSLFIASLAFEDGPLLTSAKISILGSSFLSGIVGYGLLTKRSPQKS